MSNTHPEMVGTIVITFDGKTGTSPTTFAAKGAQLAQLVQDFINADLHKDDPAVDGDSTINPILGSNYVMSKASYRIYPNGKTPADFTAS